MAGFQYGSVKAKGRVAACLLAMPLCIEFGKCGDKLCIRSMGITTYDGLGLVGLGHEEVEILQDYLRLAKEDIRACLSLAADRGHQLLTIASLS